MADSLEVRAQGESTMSVERIYPTLANLIAITVTARKNCVDSGNKEWEERHSDMLRLIERDLLPSGSGFDFTSHIWNREENEAFLVSGSYHVMNPDGFYDGWIDFDLYVYPCLISTFRIDCQLSYAGELSTPESDHKEYISEVYEECLSRPVTTSYDVEADWTQVSFA